MCDVRSAEYLTRLSYRNPNQKLPYLDSEVEGIVRVGVSEVDFR